MSGCLLTVCVPEVFKKQCKYSIRNCSGTSILLRCLNRRKKINKKNETDSGDKTLRLLIKTPILKDRALRYANDLGGAQDPPEQKLHLMKLRRYWNSPSVNKRKNKSDNLPEIYNKRYKYRQFIIEEMDDECDEDDSIYQKCKSSVNSPPRYET